MIQADFQMAYASFKTTKVRSLLTVLGIAVGVASIVLVYALGKGLQKSIVNSTSRIGKDIIAVTPGKLVTTSSSGKLKSVNLSAFIGSSTLTEKDVEVIKSVSGVDSVAPIGIISGAVQTEVTLNNAGTTVIGTTPEIRKILNQNIKFGSFFGNEDSARYLAVIGGEAAKSLFQEESPIGRMFNFRGSEFVVKGVFDEFTQGSTNPAINYNKTIFIPLETAKKLGGGVLEIREIQAKVNDSQDIKAVSESIRLAVLKEHKNQDDFSIFKQDEYTSIANQLFNYITAFITAIAGISLFVGGVGIMNIMFVSVTERTKEIGVRKALGATSRQILGQFLMESIILSAIGGLLGIVSAGILGYLISLQTSLSPAFDLITIGLAMVLSIIVGAVFGITPAIKASGQDPIKSLRHH